MNETNATQFLHVQKSKKLVFVFSVFASAFFSVILFSSLGSNLGIRLIWAMVGLTTVIFQTNLIREYYNTTKKKRFMYLAMYLLFTLCSFGGTVGFGVSQMDKMKNMNADKEIMIENIDAEIEQLQNSDVILVKKARLKSLQSKASHSTNSWVFSHYDKKVTALTEDIYNNTENLKRVADLKNKKAEILMNQTGITTAIEGLSKVFKVENHVMTFIFLFFAGLMIELMVFNSASFRGSLFNFKTKKEPKMKITKVKKEIENGQIFLKAL